MMSDRIECDLAASTGVHDGQALIKQLLAGASAVQVGTANFADPRICFRLTSDTEEWCAKQGVERFADLIGTADLIAAIQQHPGDG